MAVLRLPWAYLSPRRGFQIGSLRSQGAERKRQQPALKIGSAGDSPAPVGDCMCLPWGSARCSLSLRERMLRTWCAHCSRELRRPPLTLPSPLQGRREGRVRVKRDSDPNASEFRTASPSPPRLPLGEGEFGGAPALALPSAPSRSAPDGPLSRQTAAALPTVNKYRRGAGRHSRVACATKNDF